MDKGIMENFKHTLKRTKKLLAKVDSIYDQHTAYGCEAYDCNTCPISTVTGDGKCGEFVYVLDTVRTELADFLESAKEYT